MYRIIGITVIVSLVPTTVCWAESVELNVVRSSRASFGSAQQWAGALSKLRNVRVRSNTNQAPRPELKWVGSTLYVTAVIGANDELVVPGRKFSARQTPALAAWIEEQKSARTRGSTEARDQKFGLTASEIEQVHELLKAVVTTSTKDVPTRDVLRGILRSNNLPLRIDARILQVLGETKTITEWEGYSVGTVLAALLRPHAMVMVPEVTSRRVQLSVQSEDAVVEGWPVGWPSKLKKQELVPKLFETLPIEIYDTSIRDVMTALEGRVETPIIFDEGLLSAAQMDPDSIKVTIKAKRSFYGKVIRKAAFDAKMKTEIRTDEQGKPFFWVTPAILPR